MITKVLIGGHSLLVKTIFNVYNTTSLVSIIKVRCVACCTISLGKTIKLFMV